MCLFVCLFVCVTPGAIPYLTAKNHRDIINFQFSYFFRHILGFEPALSPYMHSPIHFAFITILPSCFTLWSCVWKPYSNIQILNIAGSCMWPAVFDGTIRETVSYYPRSYLSRTYTYRTVPSKTAGHNAYSNRAFKCKIIMWSNLEELVCMRSVSGDACRAR